MSKIHFDLSSEIAYLPSISPPIIEHYEKEGGKSAKERSD